LDDLSTADFLLKRNEWRIQTIVLMTQLGRQMFSVVSKTNCRGNRVILRSKSKGASRVSLEKKERALERKWRRPAQTVIELKGTGNLSSRQGISLQYPVTVPGIVGRDAMRKSSTYGAASGTIAETFRNDSENGHDFRFRPTVQLSQFNLY